MKKMKKKKEEKRCSGARMGYCPFFLSLSHNTTSCIVTQGLIGMARARSRCVGARKGA